MKKRNTDYMAFNNIPVVYVIRAGYTHYKIGVSENVTKRLRQLQTGNPERLKVIHIQGFPDISIARIIEKHLHRMLKDYRLNGEWFEILTQSELDSVIDTMGVMAKISKLSIDVNKIKET